MATCDLHLGDALEVLKTLPSESVHCCVTSPPYWGLRDYGVDGQLGLEKTPEEFIANLVAVFAEVRRVLWKDGTLWIVIGDSHASAGKNRTRRQATAKSTLRGGIGNHCLRQQSKIVSGLKPKDLVGIPWILGLALRSDGWWLKQSIVREKIGGQPESCTDRPPSAYEYVLLLSKSANCYYDHKAIKVPAAASSIKRLAQNVKAQRGSFRANGGAKTNGPMKAVGGEMVAKRNVWRVAVQPYSGAHSATYPPKLIEPCILAGCPKGGIVLDPFLGSGTTGLVALRHGCNFIGIELNPEYLGIARKRIEPERAQQKLFT